MIITAENWYDKTPDLSQHYQGDIVKDVPFMSFPASLPASKEDIWPIVRPVNAPGMTATQAMRQLPRELIGRAAKDVPDRWTDVDGEWVVAQSKKQDVMIVSRSCQLDHPARKHTLVAPVVAISSLPQEQRSDDKLASLRKNEIPHLFYLPATDGFTESYADLLRLTPLHRSFFPDDGVASNLRLRLTSLGMGTLQATLSEYFGVQFGFDAEKDLCPQTGRYACLNCFCEGGQSDPKDFTKGSMFGPCPKCKEDAAWIKLRV